MSDRKLTISFGSGAVLPNNAQLARVTGVERLSWSALVSRLTQSPPVTQDKASAGWFCCAEFKGRHRDTESFVARHCLALDYDHITPAEMKIIFEAFRGMAFVAYTTASHMPEAPRLRVVMPLDRPCTADEFCAVSRRIACLADIELASRESHTPAQMMYLPTVKPGSVFRVKTGEGAWVGVDYTLGLYADWTDKSSWPARKDHDTLTSGKGEDPLEKGGVIGAFNRAFGIEEAITRFELPYERVR